MAYQIITLYNVDAAVGAGRPNQPADVLLVQFLLTELAKRANQISNPQQGGSWAPPATPLVVNGAYSPNLAAWIKSYQATIFQSDGIVDPQSNPHWKVSGTICFLNIDYRRLYGAARHNNLANDASVPFALRAALKQQKPSGSAAYPA